MAQLRQRQAAQISAPKTYRSLTEHRFRHLPVITNGALVGIISIGDVVKHHLAEVTMEATAMREYITHS
jgi:CBS domain-containing protein